MMRDAKPLAVCDVGGVGSLLKVDFCLRDQLCIFGRKAERGRMRPRWHMGLIPGEKVGTVYFFNARFIARRELSCVN
jgi:hypothetical protein